MICITKIRGDEKRGNEAEMRRDQNKGKEQSRNMKRDWSRENGWASIDCSVTGRSGLGMSFLIYLNVLTIRCYTE